jgi:nucleoside-diphosphate-sugar epimerase
VFRLPWVTGDAFSPESAEHWRKQRGRRDGFGTYLHATDAARAFALALEKPRDSFEAYHFCAAEVMSYVPLAEQLKEHHPGVPPLPGDWPPFKSPVLTGKAREHFGWEPAWNFLDHCRAHYGCEPGL